MPNRPSIRRFGVPGTPRPRLRLLAALLAALQLAAPVAAASADPSPPPAGHADHVGAADGTGCAPFHDEIFCLSCRVLFAPSLHAGPLPGTAAAGDADLADVSARTDGLHDHPTASRLNARAPPRI